MGHPCPFAGLYLPPRPCLWLPSLEPSPGLVHSTSFLAGDSFGSPCGSAEGLRAWTGSPQPGQETRRLTWPLPFEAFRSQFAVLLLRPLILFGTLLRVILSHLRHLDLPQHHKDILLALLRGRHRVLQGCPHEQGFPVGRLWGVSSCCAGSHFQAVHSIWTGHTCGEDQEGLDCWKVGSCYRSRTGVFTQSYTYHRFAQQDLRCHSVPVQQLPKSFLYLKGVLCGSEQLGRN